MVGGHCISIGLSWTECNGISDELYHDGPKNDTLIPVKVNNYLQTHLYKLFLSCDTICQWNSLFWVPTASRIQLYYIAKHILPGKGRWKSWTENL